MFFCVCVCVCAMGRGQLHKQVVNRSLLRLLGTSIVVYYSLAENLKIKVSKIL